jgi:uncharacterized membrane protein YciS (DUF1049 family)
MPPGGADFVSALAAGKSATEAMKTAVTADSRFDLSANLAALLSAGVFIGYSLAGDTWLERSGRRA